MYKVLTTQINKTSSFEISHLDRCLIVTKHSLDLSWQSVNKESVVN